MGTHVLLHLGGVDFIDSGGLGMLARYLTRAQNAGGALKLCALSPKVDDVLRITRLKPVFQVYETDAESIADVTARKNPSPPSVAPTSSAWTRRSMCSPTCACCSSNRATGCSRRPTFRTR